MVSDWIAIKTAIWRVIAIKCYYRVIAIKDSNIIAIKTGAIWRE